MQNKREFKRKEMHVDDDFSQNAREIQKIVVRKANEEKQKGKVRRIDLNE